MTFPPDRSVGSQRHVRENSVSRDRPHGVSVGVRTGARRDAETAGFRIDRPKPTVLTDAQPGNIIADGVDLPALHGRRRHQHREIGLAAGARKRAADISDLAIRAFDADDQHMLGEPAFLMAELASDTQSQAFFRQQRVAAIARADAPDRIVLRVMTNEAALDVEVGLGMQTTCKIVGIAQMIERDLAHARHDAHVEHDIDAVGYLNADFAERRAPGAH